MAEFHEMRSSSFLMVVALCCIARSAMITAAEPGPEIVVANRYLQAKGVSHAHLYLYREDGRLLRQLTNRKLGQDRNPVFAPDGKTIVFTHEMEKAGEECWSVGRDGGGLQQLKSAPEWYRTAQNSPFFTNLKPEGWPAETPAPGSPAMEGEEPVRIRAPDGSVELVLQEVKDDDSNGVDGPGHGGKYLLRDLKTGKETKMEDVPGFEGLWELWHRSDGPEAFFLFERRMRLAFFGLHLNSTEGDTTFALDLNGPRLVRLSPGLAIPVLLPGEPAFLTMTYERCLPIPQSTKTANCNWLERWDSAFKKVRYAKADSAPICYGASMYRPGKKPAVTLLRHEKP